MVSFKCREWTAQLPYALKIAQQQSCLRLFALAGYLSEVLKIAGPFLVVVPLSTVPNWIKEFRKWTPQLNALVYVGDSKSRDVIRNYEFFNHKGAARPYRFEVLTD